jgi:TDG/mug DNA glycosylase family protein
MTPAPATPDPHRATVDVYEARGPEWEELRSPRLDEVAAFTGSLGPDDRPVVDLGCGPGWHLADLPSGTFAVDAAAAMLALTPKYAAASPRARADLRALPFRRGGLGAVWANKSYVHVDRRAMPMAWWDLHRSLRVGAPAFIGVFSGDEDHAVWAGDDFAGRSFSHWPDDLLGHVVEGAGFEVRDWVRRPESDGVTFHGMTLRRARTLADTVGAGMRLLLVGLNPSVYAADVGVGFARPGNRAWPALLESGLATVDRDPVALLRDGAVGMTDLVKRATARADELDTREFVRGLDRLDALCRWLQPGAVCVLGITGWRAATGDRTARVGTQDRTLGGRPVHVMPNPSGLNAHTSVADLVDHLRTALALGDQT